MLEASDPWNLFGYDIRRGPHYIRAGWKEFLWGDESPVLGMVDEVVEVRLESGETRYYKAGKAVAQPGSSAEVAARAMVVPEKLALIKSLRIPVAAEADLESMLSLEVRASSPFPETDTCYGWLVSGRSASELEVQLVLSSRSAVMEYVASQTDSHDVNAFELWVHAHGRMVQLSGFGEGARRLRNRSRMLRMASVMAYCLLLLMLVFAIGAAAKYLELQKVQGMQQEVAASAAQAVELRTQLVSSKAMITAANTLLSEYPSPHLEMKRLSALLGDDTWLSSIEVKGAKIKIEGESVDASAVMQQLLDNPAYSRVEAPIAFKTGRSGMERFTLNLTLAAEDASQ